MDLSSAKQFGHQHGAKIVNPPRQIPLDLTPPRRARASRSEFAVSQSNAEALGFLDGWASWPDQRLALIGPEGCGKTHLAMIWSEACAATFIEENGFSARDLAQSGRVIFEDCDRRIKTPEQERALFHLLNILREEGGTILMTARTPPSRWSITLPDLASRLSAITVAQIHPPDDDLLELLVSKLFSDRDILVKDSLVSYISRRIHRNAVAAEETVARLDAESLATGDAITLKMVKDVLDGNDL